ncbi:MAG TPA: hypothetical protein PKC30_09665 [Saprospiraceae bacterium]|nr:hypothetical protein [Saprospiraceae bacterium]
MDNYEPTGQNDNSFFKNPEIKDFLLETAKWGKLLAIVGYIGLGIMILLGILVLFGFSNFADYSDSFANLGFIGFLYIIIGAVYYFPITYLYKYSIQIRKGMVSHDLNTITSGFQNLKSLFKFMGILTIATLSLYGLILLIMIPSMLFFN